MGERKLKQFGIINHIIGFDTRKRLQTNLIVEIKGANLDWLLQP